MKMRVTFDNGHIDVESEDDLEDVMLVLVARAERAARRGDEKAASAYEANAMGLSEQWRAIRSGHYQSGPTMAH